MATDQKAGGSNPLTHVTKEAGNLEKSRVSGFFCVFLKASFCGKFVPDKVVVACDDNLIRDKFLTNCDAHLAESIFQTHSRVKFELAGNTGFTCFYRT